jgi:hypothetical protein
MHCEVKHSDPTDPHPDKMKLFRYFNVGRGKTVKYNEEASFQPNYTVKTEFSRTSNDSKKPKKKKTSSRSLLFCPEAMVFENEEMYEHHQMSENHTPIQQTSGMDKVRASFVKNMKVSSASNKIYSSTNVNISEMTSSSAIGAVSLFSKVTHQGWAIPQKNTFRYSYQQKKKIV